MIFQRRHLTFLMEAFSHLIAMMIQQKMKEMHQMKIMQKRKIIINFKVLQKKKMMKTIIRKTIRKVQTAQRIVQNRNQLLQMKLSLKK